MTYRLIVDAPDSLTVDQLTRAVEDGLESLGGGLHVQYRQIGYAEGLPDPGERTADFPADQLPLEPV